MNRYVLRSLVAVLTFSIGVAVGSLGSRPAKYRYRAGNCYSFKQEARFKRTTVLQNYDPSWSGPFVSIDTLSNDPLKLSYSSTTPISNDLARQKVELQVANNTKREITNFTVAYRSRWRSIRQNGGGAVFVDAKTKTSSSSSTGLDIVSIECSGDENLTIWVSSVEFKDGSRWNNTRHSN